MKVHQRSSPAGTLYEKSQEQRTVISIYVKSTGISSKEKINGIKTCVHQTAGKMQREKNNEQKWGSRKETGLSCREGFYRNKGCSTECVLWSAVSPRSRELSYHRAEYAS